LCENRPGARLSPRTPVGAAFVRPTVNVEVGGWGAPTEAAAVYSPFCHRTGPHNDRLSDVTIGKAHQVEFCSCESLSYDFVLVLFRSWCASLSPFLVSDF